MTDNLDQVLTTDNALDSLRKLPPFPGAYCQPGGIFYLSIPLFPFAEHVPLYQSVIADTAQANDVNAD